MQGAKLRIQDARAEATQNGENKSDKVAETKMVERSVWRGFQLPWKAGLSEATSACRRPEQRIQRSYWGCGAPAAGVAVRAAIHPAMSCRTSSCTWLGCEYSAGEEGPVPNMNRWFSPG